MVVCLRLGFSFVEAGFFNDVDADADDETDKSEEDVEMTHCE